LNIKFNLHKSPIDERDFIYRSLVKIIELPESFDREAECSSVRNQGDNGFCYAFSGEAMKEQQEWKEYPDLKPIFSPLFLAKNCKDIDGIPEDEGSYIRSVMDVLFKIGICCESSYPYESYEKPLKFPIISDIILEEASKYKIKSYATCNSLEEIKTAIYNNGLVLAGILVCSNFMYPENGFINNPEGSILGGHAITLIGWDDNLQHTYKNGKTRKGFLKCKNSWGEEWGDSGYFYLPYDFYNGSSDTVAYFFEAWSSIDIIHEPEVKKYWRVQIGSFVYLENANKLRLEIKYLGLNAIIKEVNGLYKVQLGVYSIKENAYKKVEYVKSLGFTDAFVVYY
jgi:C1A family cysteine protease